MYGIDVATGTINVVTDQLLNELEAWKIARLVATIQS